MESVGKAEEEWRTTTAVGDYFLDPILATEGVLHEVRLERVTGPGLSLSMRSFRSQPRPTMWRATDAGQLGTEGGGWWGTVTWGSDFDSRQR